ncbi:RNA polymerase sigma factor [Lutimonas sp.]|uniref:RNA polymerase sigma factor n=1 Tax=Lutimonas sp. TaxID=1872403 RepID=UPI003C74265A
MDRNTQVHLIEKCKKNDNRAQMQLYDLYCKAMFNTAFNFIKDDDIAQDVMQEAFIKAFKKIGTYTGEASFGSWLKRIVINQSLDWLKKQKLDTVELKEEIAFLPNDEPLEVDPEISMAVIYKCIEALPQKCKNVVKLYLLEGYDHQEVAQILEISEVASRSQLSRGKSKLKELLIHENYES